jgi:hypothetical protein
MKIPTQVQTAWVGGTTPLPPFAVEVTAASPPAGLTPALAGLWWDAKGDWKRAHKSAQRDKGPEGSWVHAYLHRKEGEQGNAAYWYGRAGKPGHLSLSASKVECEGRSLRAKSSVAHGWTLIGSRFSKIAAPVCR